VKAFLAACAAGVALLIGLPMSLADRLIFQPTPGVDITPAQLGIAGEEVFLRTEDGVRIHAFWLPTPGATRAILFLHGNAGNASHRLPNAAQLAALDTHVLLADYRGYGRSEGRPSEGGVYADARAALAHLTDERGVPEQRVIVFGRSLGGGVAVDLARGRPLAGLILESTFTSLTDVARASFGPLAGVLGRRLFQQAPQPKAFETLQGAGHNDTVEVGGKPYFERIRRFLDDVTPA
jgi:pimeloyl-ACP methyl ester carboxylesterase